VGANRTEKVYTLDNGVNIMPSELARKLHMSNPSARCRLEKYSDPVAVFRVVGSSRSKRTYKCKAYTLSDNTQQTARQIATQYGIPLSTIRNRLSTGVTDIEKLTAMPNKKMQHNLGKLKPAKTILLNSQDNVSQLMKTRNYFDPLSRLLLKTI